MKVFAIGSAVLALILSESRIPWGSVAAQQRLPDAYALVIGVSSYPKFPGDQQLKYPAADASLFAEFLESSQGGGFPARQVRVLTDSAATRENIYRAMQWIGSQAREQDVVYVFFAGHGIKDETDDAVYLMPYDANPSNPAALGIRADLFLEEIRRRFSARQVIAFIDACYSGAALNPGGVARGNDNIVSELRRLWANAFNDESLIRMAFISARPGQLSWESESLRHGLFTWYLVHGLKGAADSPPRDGIVRAGELSRFLEDSVEAFSVRTFRREQTPVVSPYFRPDFPLAYLPASQRQPGVAPSPPPPPPIVGDQTSTRSFLPQPTYNEVPIQTSDWLQIRGWTIFYRYSLYLGNASDEYSTKCSPDLRIVGDWGWGWSRNGIGVTCLDNDWLSFDLSRVRGALSRPTRVNITGAGQDVWGLHGHTRFLAPCLLSETGSPNLVFQGVENGVRLTKLTSVPSEEAWVSEPQNRHLDVCQGGHVVVTSRTGTWPFQKPR